MIQYDAKIQHMYETVLNYVSGWNFAKRTILICKINLDIHPVLKESTPNRHAEQLLLTDLEQRTDLKTVTIYMSNSPCSNFKNNCASEMIRFLNSHVHVYMDVYITHLFNLRIMSCFEDHINYPYPYYQRHTSGLRNLMLHDRCRVLAYNKDAWIDLLHFVKASANLDEYCIEGYRTQGDNHDRSRENEDDRIREELLYIRSQQFVLQQPLNVLNN